MQSLTRILARPDPPMPDWFSEVRPHQFAAVYQIMAAYQDVDIVVLDAPTGSGKTLIAELVRRCLGVRGLYVCTTKTLQDQCARDYPYAKVLKGRSNYPTERFPEVSCEDCTWSPETACPLCTSKHACPYESAKRECLTSDLGIVNTSYFLTECNYIGKFASQEFVIADEADTLERELMGFVSVEISKFRAAKYKLQPPKKVTVAESWAEWIDETLPVLSSAKSRANGRDLKEIQEHKYLERLIRKLKNVRDGLGLGYWVYTGRGEEISFRPSRVDSLGADYLWSHSKKWLLMSATVISDQELTGSLGLDREHRLVRVPSTFPVENRRVVVQPVADMSKKKDEREELANGVASVLARHPDDRVLVHTVSYDLADYLVRNVTGDGDRALLSYRTSSEREDSLQKFTDTRGAVLFAPSLDRGVDLVDEDCRVQIIAKVPFPYLGDRQVSARLHSRGGDTWYRVQTVRTIVQMCGRAVRHEDDWAITYMLDRQFKDNVWGRGRSLFPAWWKEALEWRR